VPREIQEDKDREIQSLREQLRQFQEESQQVKEELKGEMKEVRDYIQAHPAPKVRLSKKGKIKGVRELIDYIGAQELEGHVHRLESNGQQQQEIQNE
jgi:hypothetical protein